MSARLYFFQGPFFFPFLLVVAIDTGNIMEESVHASRNVGGGPQGEECFVSVTPAVQRSVRTYTHTYMWEEATLSEASRVFRINGANKRQASVHHRKSWLSVVLL